MRITFSWNEWNNWINTRFMIRFTFLLVYLVYILLIILVWIMYTEEKWKWKIKIKLCGCQYSHTFSFIMSEVPWLKEKLLNLSKPFYLNGFCWKMNLRNLRKGRVLPEITDIPKMAPVFYAMFVFYDAKKKRFFFVFLGAKKGVIQCFLSGLKGLGYWLFTGVDTVIKNIVESAI